MRKIGGIIFFFIFLLPLPGARAQVFSPSNVKFLVDQDNGAEVRVQKFYHYFKKDRDPALPVPPWIDRILPAMLRQPVWNDPEQGLLNEAQLWQDPVAVLYEFFEFSRKSFLPKDGGQMLSPVAELNDYADNHVRFQMALDRLYRAHLSNSLEGRGRPLLADFSLIEQEMRALLDTLTSSSNPPSQEDLKRYRQAVLAVGALSNDAYNILHEAPRGESLMQEGEAPEPSPAVDYILKMLGLLLIFMFGWSAAVLNEERISSALEQYKTKVREWAHEYERQFLAIKINYLVGIPVALGGLIGILTFNIWGFILFTFMGIYAGLSLPGFLLKNLRFRRAIKCEKQLMDTIILMSNGLKSGVDLVQCIGLVQRDLQPPISEEFGLCLKNYQLGTPLEKALEGIQERVPSHLLAYLIKAVVIQRSVGGNLTKIFDRIVEIIREESKLAEKTSAMTAQQRIQAVIVGIMPWVMITVMFIFQPGPMTKFYFTPLGVAVLAFCTVWIAIGMKIINTLGDIKI